MIYNCVKICVKFNTFYLFQKDTQIFMLIQYKMNMLENNTNIM